ncbi:RNA polymerase sigma factor [Candidatus Parcubacteria bacterium]|nr:RNA polymerase sigma factor [Candidatus Parcubacteria bacterium]
METQPVEARFAEIYKTEVDSVFRFCLLRTSDHELALDLTQDTFMRFWNSLCQEKIVKNSRAFLFAIARNLIIDWYRRKKAISLESLLFEGAEDKNDLLASASKVEIDAEASYLLKKIAELDPLYREAVYLRCVEELKPREIAEVLSESANVISVRINRGLSQLRKLLHYENT